MAEQIWIDSDDLSTIEVGETGFLVEVENQLTGYHAFSLYSSPPKTNQSHQYRAHGWCGTTNDTAVYGRGVWRVVRVAKNGRIKIEKITDRSKLETFLEECGFPGLLEACLEQ